MKATAFARTLLSLSFLSLLLCDVAFSAAAPAGSGVTFHNSSNPPTSPYPQSVAVADFNGDGKLDMAVPVYSFATSTVDVNIFLGKGIGTFEAGPAFPLTGQNVNNVAVGDFNGDGKVDLAISLPVC